MNSGRRPSKSGERECSSSAKMHPRDLQAEQKASVSSGSGKCSQRQLFAAAIAAAHQTSTAPEYSRSSKMISGARYQRVQTRPASKLGRSFGVNGRKPRCVWMEMDSRPVAEERRRRRVRICGTPQSASAAAAAPSAAVARAGACAEAGAHLAGHAEVAELQLASRRQQDVRGLQVAVQHAVRVQERERVQRL